MKRVFIVHGWDFNPEMNFYPWLKKELEKKGYKVTVPEMPETAEPKIKDWVAHLKKAVGKPDNETYFIGHSIGCQTIMRYLEIENIKLKIPKIVFVAGWFKLDNLEDEEVEEIARPWLQTPINLEKVKQRIKSLKVFLSTDDPFNCLDENSKTFKNSLGAEVTLLKNRGHFEEDKITEILNEF